MILVCSVRVGMPTNQSCSSSAKRRAGFASPFHNTTDNPEPACQIRRHTTSGPKVWSEHISLMTSLISLKHTDTRQQQRRDLFHSTSAKYRLNGRCNNGSIVCRSGVARSCSQAGIWPVRTALRVNREHNSTKQEYCVFMRKSS